MTRRLLRRVGFAAAALLLLAPTAQAEDLLFEDPAQDDFGPGSYVYPTDAVYKPGSFDLRKVEVKDKGSKIEFHVTLSARIEDPWDSKSWDGNGFSIQMVQVYIDTDHKAASGFTKTLPGINATFGADDAWDKVVMISPQTPTRISQELTAKAASMKRAVVVPKKTSVRGKTLIAVVKKSDLGGAPAASWGVQVIMQSNEGYPDKDELLSRKVNEFAGQHRFGGGNDWSCDPHVIDMLAGKGTGDASEIEAQKRGLAYTCGSGGESVKGAVLPMVRAAGR